MKIIPIIFAIIAIASPLRAAELSIDSFFDAFSAEWMRDDPEGATAFQCFEGAEQDALDRKLTPITKKYRSALLRAKAKKALGEKFSIKEFHNVILRTGGVPLVVLERLAQPFFRAKIQ